jgi:hypothetical protein
MRLLLLCCCIAASSVGAQPCGDCNHDGQVTVLDALGAAQRAVGLPTVAGGQSCNVDGVCPVTILDALLIAQEAAGPITGMRCDFYSPFDHGFFADAYIQAFTPVFIDSWDSSREPYSPHPVPSPFTIPVQNLHGQLGSNGHVSLFHPANEIHGPVRGGAGASALVAGLIDPGVTTGVFPGYLSMDPIPAADIDAAILDNDNDLINAAATIDPAYYAPGEGPYDPVTGVLSVRGPGTRVVLGAPGGLRGLHLTRIELLAGGVIEVVGPVHVFLAGGLTLDSQDGVCNLRSSEVPASLRLYAYGPPGTTVQLEPCDCPGDPFQLSLALNAPSCTVELLGSGGDLFGAIICNQLLLSLTGMLRLHQDEGLLRLIDLPPPC